MTTKSTSISNPPLSDRLQSVKSGDRFWILTAPYNTTSRFFTDSPEQLLFRFGAYDLQAQQLAWRSCGVDTIRAILRADTTAFDFTPNAIGFSISRSAHVNGEKGRFKTTASTTVVDPALQPFAANWSHRLNLWIEKDWSSAAPTLAERKKEISTELYVEAELLKFVQKHNSFKRESFAELFAGNVLDSVVGKILRKATREGKLALTGKTYSAPQSKPSSTIACGL